MKRTIYALLLLIGAVVLTVACEKGNTVSSSQSKTKLVKEILSDGQTEMAFEYDDRNRLIKATDGYRGYEYEYDGNTISEKVISGGTEFYYKYYLDDDGYIIRCEDVLQSQSFPNYKYENGMLKSIEKLEPSMGGTTNIRVANKFDWQNGDIVKNTHDRSGGQMSYKYTDIDNILNIDFYDLTRLTMLPYFIKSKGAYSRHLPKSIDDNYFIRHYSYEFDADGYVTKFTETFEDGTSYEYTVSYCAANPNVPAYNPDNDPSANPDDNPLIGTWNVVRYYLLDGDGAIRSDSEGEGEYFAFTETEMSMYDSYNETLEVVKYTREGDIISFIYEGYTTKYQIQKLTETNMTLFVDYTDDGNTSGWYYELEKRS